MLTPTPRASHDQTHTRVVSRADLTQDTASPERVPEGQLWGGKLLKPIKWGFLEYQRSFLMPNPVSLLNLLLPLTPLTVKFVTSGISLSPAY